MSGSASFTAAAVHHIVRFSADDSGATAIEYALVASGVGVAVAATVYTLGSRVNALFTTLAGLFQ